MLSALFAMLLMLGLPGSPEAAGPAVRVTAAEGLYNIRADNAPLGEVLQKLAEAAGIGFFSYGPLEETVTVEIEGLPLERALARLAPNYGVIYRSGPDGTNAPSGIAALGGGEARPPKPSFSRRLAYGAGDGELGLLEVPEMERKGPESFALGPGGVLLACDTLNSRILVIPPGDGKISTFPVPAAPTDIAVSGASIFVLGRDGNLFEFDLSGKLRGQSRIPGKLLAERQSLEADSRGPRLLTRDGEEYLLAGGNSPRRAEAGPAARKTASGALISLEGGSQMELNYPGLLSVTVLGRDSEENLILQVESVRENPPGVGLNVLKLSPEGTILAARENLPNNYSNWTARLLAVSPAGDLGQLLPGPDGVSVNWWAWPGEPVNLRNP